MKTFDKILSAVAERTNAQGEISTRSLKPILSGLGIEPNRENLQKYFEFARKGWWKVRPSHENRVPVASDSVSSDPEITIEQNSVSGEPIKGQNVPQENPNFKTIPLYREILAIVKTNLFSTVYITGESGNGKTASVIQACAKAGRDFFRVNINESTSEHDLLGSYTLINGETVWRDGLVVQAMKAGGVLLLDEVDLGTPKILCLQPILEGSFWKNPKTGEIVRPAEGFQIFATANTKGQLNNRSAKFVGARAQNEAFLDRFDFMIEHDYPKKEIEKEIVLSNLRGFFDSMGGEIDDKDEQFAENLVELADRSRKAYANESVTDLITTRRVMACAKAYALKNRNEVKAIKMILARFSQESASAYLNMYKTISNVDFGDE